MGFTVGGSLVVTGVSSNYFKLITDPDKQPSPVAGYFNQET